MIGTITGFRELYDENRFICSLIIGLILALFALLIIPRIQIQPDKIKHKKCKCRKYIKQLEGSTYICMRCNRLWCLTKNKGKEEEKID